jgi:beta-lactamase superfamily II metal-dependent hydrolase
MANDVGYEIDFIKVGDGERSGDAIAVRVGSDATGYKVMVVDGGNKDSGQELVDHIKAHYGTSHVDYLVNTHPDADHASGLEVVLGGLTVGEVWVHQPWHYPDAIVHWFKDGRITVTSLAERLQDAMYHAYRVEELAKQKGIPVREPYQGARIGEYFWVASPSREWYFEILAHFDKTPEAKTKPPATGLLAKAASLAEKALAWIDEHWNIETLKDDVATSWDNESSVVLYGYVSGHAILLTGDAGIQALTRTATYLESFNINLPSTLHFVQVPHHGSRHNVGPSILNRILGPKMLFDSASMKTAFVSAGPKSTTHPRRVVTNSFLRRGAKVFTNKEMNIRHHFQMPPRQWGPIQPLPFYDKVEG